MRTDAAFKCDRGQVFPVSADLPANPGSATPGCPVAKPDMARQKLSCRTGLRQRAIAISAVSGSDSGGSDDATIPLIFGQKFAFV
jgi:hypothetical protein